MRFLTNPSNKLISLSEKSFTFYESKLLNKSFCPTPNKNSKAQLKIGIGT